MVVGGGAGGNRYKGKHAPDVIEVIHLSMTSALRPITAIYQKADNIEPGSMRNKFTKSKGEKNHLKEKGWGRYK